MKIKTTLIIFTYFITCFITYGQTVDYNSELIRLKAESKIKLANNITTFNEYKDRDENDGTYNNSNVNSFLQTNIPLFLCSDNDFTEVYNYRWWMVSKHIRNWFDSAQNKNIWVISEFFGFKPWAATSGAIPAAAGHQIYECRWLRDTQYLQSYIEYWMKGYASNHNQIVNGNFLDYINRPESHHFTSWMIDGTEAYLKVHPNNSWRDNILSSLENHQLKWDQLFQINQKNSKTNGLYKCLDVYDAQEFTISATLGLIASAPLGVFTFYANDGYKDSYQDWGKLKVPASVSSQYPLAFRGSYPQLYIARPSMNSYIYGNLKSLANLYLLKAKNSNNPADFNKVIEYNQKAADLQNRILKTLWNNDDQFFNTYTAGNNAFGISDYECRIREVVGFTPWYFNMIPKGETKYDNAWQFLGSNTGFYNTKGMSSAQISSPYYNEQAYAWNGRGWPFLNSIVNKAYANYLTNQKDTITNKDRNLLYNLINQLVTLHSNPRNIGEYYIPSNGTTIGGVGDYNHSSFADMIIEDLLGFKSSHKNEFTLHCLLPDSTWEYFYLGNISYHGHDIDIVWKKDWNTNVPGNQSAICIWVNNQLVYTYNSLNKKAIIHLNN